MLSKIEIQNYRCYRRFSLSFNKGANILVGDNDAGKSTLLEAIALPLTGRAGGRSLATDLAPYYFNATVVAEYFAALEAGKAVAPPEVIIDLFLDKADETANLVGQNNCLGDNSAGIRFRIHPDPDFSAEFKTFLEAGGDHSVLPVEYYTVDWRGFDGNPITPHRVPATVSLIDASAIRLQSGVDYYLQQIISSTLDRAERVELSRQYRSLREQFASNESVATINDKLSESHGNVSDKDLTLSIDLSSRFTWESTLVPHLDELPLQFVGRGEQNTLKVLLALSRQVQNTHVILLEEPENHLSFASLNVLMDKVEAKCGEKQVFISTHSSFVLNKLGIRNLILMSGVGHLRITDLSASSEDYFKKLPGYDTLRLVLARKVALVEGPSDELLFQRAYFDRHGHLPIRDGIDVISARGLSFKRYLDLAVPLGRRAVVIRDNDGKDPNIVKGGYADYTKHPFITVHVGEDQELRTLEPQLAAVNDLAAMNAALGGTFTTVDDLLEYMGSNKTSWAVAVLEADAPLSMPSYITEALDALA